MQSLPYVVIKNSHMSHVYGLYYEAFDVLRRVPEIKSIKENDAYCKIVQDTLREHLSVIPRLVMGVLECVDALHPEATDVLMTTLLRSVGQFTPLVARGCLLMSWKTANLTSRDSGTALSADRDIPFAMALSRRQTSKREPD